MTDDEFQKIIDRGSNCNLAQLRVWAAGHGSTAVIARITDEDTFDIYTQSDPYQAFNRGFKIAIGFMLAVTIAFNAWLIYLIWG